MPDAITEFFDFIMNGKTAGIPNIAIIIGIAMIFLLIYMLLTRTPKVKPFKPLDMKKETKRRLKRDYKYFGKSLNKNLFDSTDVVKPIAYAIGYMKIVENKPMKRYEPILPNFDKSALAMKRGKYSFEYYGKGFDALTPEEKKDVDGVAKEELMNERTQVTSAEENIKYVRGRKEIKFFYEIGMYAIKVCSPSTTSKLLARLFGYGIDWFIINNNQVNEESDKIVLTADFQRRQPFDIFVFSKEGKNLIQDFTYGQERENIWQETANQIPRAVHFDTEASKMLLYRREDAKLEKEKRKSQTESHEMG